LVFGYFFAGANDHETVGRKMVIKEIAKTLLTSKICQKKVYAKRESDRYKTTRHRSLKHQRSIPRNCNFDETVEQINILWTNEGRIILIPCDFFSIRYARIGKRKKFTIKYSIFLLKVKQQKHFRFQSGFVTLSDLFKLPR
jgi:hypothetical protein